MHKTGGSCAPGPCHEHHLTPEHTQPVRDGRAHGAVADDHDPLADQCGSVLGKPLPRALPVHELVDATGQREEKGDGQLGGGLTMNPSGRRQRRPGSIRSSDGLM